jgi:hypothetical protein
MADERAFALKEHAKDTVALAVSIDGTPVDVIERLNDGDGVLVTDDDQLIATLELVEPLKSVPVPEKKPAAKKAEKSAEKAA